MSTRSGLTVLATLIVVAACSGATATPTPLTTSSPSPSPAPTSPAVIPTATASATPTASASLAPTATAEPTTAASASLPPASPSPMPAAGGVELVAGGGSEAPVNGLLASSALLVRPSGVAVAADGTVWIVDTNLGIAVHVLADGTLGDIVTGMDGPEGLTIAPDGTVYVAERQAYRVIKLDGSGGTTRVAGDTYLPGFSGDGGLAKKAKLWLPYDVASDAAGNIYIADSANQRVRVIDAATLKIDTLGGSGTAGFSGDDGPALDAQIYGPRAIAVDPGATLLLIADTENMRVRRIDLASKLITTVAGNGAGTINYSAALTGPQTPLTHLLALTVDDAGNAYFPVFYSDLGLVIVRMDAAGSVTRVAGGGHSSQPGTSPLDFALPDVLGLAIDAHSGDMLVACGDGRILRVPGVVPAPIN